MSEKIVQLKKVDYMVVSCVYLSPMYGFVQQVVLICSILTAFGRATQKASDDSPA